MKKPKAVLISDIHFAVPTLEVATKVLTEALFQAQRMMVPLIIAGDLLDGKSIIQGKVANRLIEIFKSNKMVDVCLIVGNHDLLNEKGKEHALNFLSPYTTVVDSPLRTNYDMYLLPYFSDHEELTAKLDKISSGLTIICHQGVLGADMGHYIQDTSSLPLEAFKDFRTISGHYHKRQHLGEVHQEGNIGLFSYLGSPYTTSFSEAEDGPKGFSVLYDDGSLELWPVTTRKHVIYNETIDRFFDFNGPLTEHNPGDLIWLKIEGSKSLLDLVDKNELGKRFLGTTDYRLELIPFKSGEVSQDLKPESKPTEILDGLIDVMPDSAEHREFLKNLYKELLK